MSDAVTLTVATPPTQSLLADCVTADRFAALSEQEIAGLPVIHGGRRATLGDFFRVRGERSSVVRLDGDLRKMEGIGAGMAGGELVVDGSVGRVHGSAGENAGGALPGAARGMTGGEIVIRGDAGAQAGAAARRGLIVVTGDAGPQAARGMIAGTVVVFGRAGPGAGRFLKRGSIVALGAIERPATFGYACTYRPPYVALLLRYLRARYGLAIADRQVTGRYERHAGDLAELGRGEILQWVAE